MPTRDIEKNQVKQAKALERNEKNWQSSAKRDYKNAIAVLSLILNKYSIDGKLDAQYLSKFNRQTKLQKEIAEVVNFLLKRTGTKINRLIDLEAKQAFFRYAWTIDQAAGVAFKWRI